MADVNTKLYASQGNGGSPSVSIAEVAALVVGGHLIAHQADSVATTVAELVTDFNALLAKLQAAGLMA